jgi:hypothetical protein
LNGNVERDAQVEVFARAADEPFEPRRGTGKVRVVNVLTGFPGELDLRQERVVDALARAVRVHLHRAEARGRRLRRLEEVEGDAGRQRRGQN